MMVAIYVSSLLLNILEPFMGEMGYATFGGITGFSVGYAIKKIFKVLLILFGVFFIIFQILSHYEIIVVNWMKVQLLVENLFNNGNKSVSNLLQFLTANLPTAGGFTAGFVIGFKKG